ncbi:uncharacterized protein BYT42DRAFT_556640 [Radiomyces spectabilis]|uniref:uncharacterized protein n=1 Tax=Radiomyces spectabilis TaxID=64574 RepID=UPI0022211CF9|nr:uncharacterized protein BYT42DRAFT_556640 [Radiomyces spectabilis]KAI8391367.1 hypothetical protein BYT42DRAFT_556640 [Radiomyces spectabilis]
MPVTGFAVYTVGGVSFAALACRLLDEDDLCCFCSASSSSSASVSASPCPSFPSLSFAELAFLFLLVRAVAGLVFVSSFAVRLEGRGGRRDVVLLLSSAIDVSHTSFITLMLLFSSCKLHEQSACSLDLSKVS